ncbi:hypothetical protein AmDm5_0151 [Acetobacter malorum]|nr:hypothetical protein AmDm5_0151 [Acetobacter malorum]
MQWQIPRVRRLPVLENGLLPSGMVMGQGFPLSGKDGSRSPRS